MPKVEFDPKISIGNIVTIAIVLAGMITAWNTVVNRQTALAEKLAAMEQTIAAGRADRLAAIAAHEGRIRAVELAQASQTSDLRNIQQTLGEIKVQLDKIALKP